MFVLRNWRGLLRLCSHFSYTNEQLKSVQIDSLAQPVSKFCVCTLSTIQNLNTVRRTHCKLFFIEWKPKKYFIILQNKNCTNHIVSFTWHIRVQLACLGLFLVSVFPCAFGFILKGFGNTHKISTCRNKSWDIYCYKRRLFQNHIITMSLILQCLAKMWINMVRHGPHLCGKKYPSQCGPLLIKRSSVWVLFLATDVFPMLGWRQAS